MDRREFIKLAATSAALASANIPGGAFARARDEWAAAFHAALAKKPWLLGWLGTEAPRLETPRLKIEGRLPEGLTGTFYRNGPGRHEIAGMRYHHWFDGDGMVQAFRIADGAVSHLGRLVETAKFRAERKAGRARRATFGTSFPGMEPVTNPDSINPANISVLAHGGRFFALWEGGSPYLLDPNTLATKGEFSWSPETKGLPFSAHPRADVDGSLWNIGYASFAGVVVLYHIGANGRLRAAVPMRLDSVPMVHDFVITKRHLVIVLPPIEVDRNAGSTFLDWLVWRPDRPARVLVIDKADLSKRRLFEMPAHFSFHYGNAWEDDTGVITMDTPRYPDFTAVSESMRYVMRGEVRPGLPAQHHLVSIDTKSGSITEIPIVPRAVPVEFPYVDRRLAGRRNRRVVLLLRDPKAGAAHPHFNSVARLDIENGALETYNYSPTTLAEEHIFVPRPGRDGEDDGWIIGTSLDFAAGVTRFSVFDAARLADGPLAVASLPYAIPLGFHGTFVAA